MRPLPILLTVVMSALALPAEAERLRVDVLVFLHPESLEEAVAAPRHPDDPQALPLDDLRGLAYGGISLLPESGNALNAEWQQLTRLGGARRLLRLSWLQLDAPRENGAALRLHLPSGDGASGLDGWIRLNKGQRALLSADVEYAQAEALPGQPRRVKSWRLREQRRVDMDTVQYFDSARVGLLAKVSVVP